MITTTPTTIRRAPRRGAAATEYALVFLLIAGGVLVAANVLSGFQQDTFGHLAESSGHHVHRGQAAAGAVRVPASDGYTAWTKIRRFADYRMGSGLIAAGGLALAISVGSRARTRRAGRKSDSAGNSQTSTLPAALQATVFEKRQAILHVLSKEQSLSADRIQMRHVMTHKLVQVRPVVSAKEVRQLMESKRLRHLLVCDGRDKLVGVISDRDLASRHGATAGELMSPEPLTVSPDTLVVPSITWMINKHVSCLPVVEAERVVGLVTTTDLLMALQCALQLLEEVQHQLHPMGELASCGTEHAAEPLASGAS